MVVIGLYVESIIFATLPSSFLSFSNVIESQSTDQPNLGEDYLTLSALARCVNSSWFQAKTLCLIEQNNFHIQELLTTQYIMFDTK